MFDLTHKYMRLFFNEAKDKLPFDNYEDFIQYYRVDHYLLENYNELVIFDDFLESQNKAFEIAGHDDSVDAMKALARETQKGKTPHYSAFKQALAGQVESFTFQDAVNVAEKTAKDVGKVAMAGAGLWLAKVIGGFIVVSMLKSYLVKGK